MVYIIILGIILFILFLPFYINIKVIKTRKANVVKIGIGFIDNRLKLFHRVNQEKIERKVQKVTDKNFLTYLKKRYDGFYNIKSKRKLIIFFKSLLYHLNINSLIIETRFGFNDAAQTAIATGMIWSIISYFIAFLESQIKVDEVNFKVLPVFCKNIMEINFDCIIKYKLVYIITAGLNCLKAKMKVVD